MAEPLDGPAVLALVPQQEPFRFVDEILEVDDELGRIASLAGPGSASGRVERLRGLLSRATAEEQDFLVRLLFGELRQGALEGVLAEAVARAAALPAA